jgi:hypothetical protein
MNELSGPRKRYVVTVCPASAARKLGDLKGIGAGFRDCGAVDLADMWAKMLGEIDGRIRDGWRDRLGRSIEQFEVTVHLAPGKPLWEIEATMQPILH